MKSRITEMRYMGYMAEKRERKKRNLDAGTRLIVCDSEKPASRKKHGMWMQNSRAFAKERHPDGGAKPSSIVLPTWLKTTKQERKYRTPTMDGLTCGGPRLSRILGTFNARASPMRMYLKGGCGCRVLGVGVRTSSGRKVWGVYGRGVVCKIWGRGGVGQGCVGANHSAHKLHLFAQTSSCEWNRSDRSQGGTMKGSIGRSVLVCGGARQVRVLNQQHHHWPLEGCELSGADLRPHHGHHGVGGHVGWSSVRQHDGHAGLLAPQLALDREDHRHPHPLVLDDGLLDLVRRQLLPPALDQLLPTAGDD
eukprot:scaffold28947_cov109-Isochrysis_galbana.AAC.2